MTHKNTSHQEIEELPKSELLGTERFLAYLHDMVDPVRRVVLPALWDDEPETDEELVRGEMIANTDLWQCLGHEPRS